MIPVRLTTPPSTPALGSPSVGATPAELLRQAREHERGGRAAEAAESYRAAIARATAATDAPVRAEALRRLGAQERRQGALESALRCCRESYDVASQANDPILMAEALNAIATVHVEQGEWQTARDHLARALSIGSSSAELRARIEQNLGVIANIQGDFRAALRHYQQSLEAFRGARDDRGCAIAYNNLGLVSADKRLWKDAEQYFAESLKLSEAMGDVPLRGAALLNRTEVLLARQQFEDARSSAETALQIFDELGMQAFKAEAYKFLGIYYRETGRHELGESRLRASLDLASAVGATLREAEASRELAILYQALGRNQDALRFLNSSHRLFGRLDARRDLVDLTSKVNHLESVYTAVVREWGRSIESSDSYTFGHSERVADYGGKLAEAYGLTGVDLTAVKLGAYLHDLGKVKVPHEILNKPGRLTDEEFGTMKRHPVFGIEMLAEVDFPWNIKPIVRSHHEKQDGSGYPDRLRGDEIPLAAQLICIVDVYDALTTTRSYRGAMSHPTAIAEMERSKHWWRPDVYETFRATFRE